MAAQATSARGGSAREAAARAAQRSPRRRDPDRKERILVAAAALGARRGFGAISMADIGAEAGIVGSGIYRHFDSKTAILVAMADRVMDRLMTAAVQIIAVSPGDREALSLLGPDLADGEVRLAVHAAIGAIQSTLFFRSGLADERLTELLEVMAHGCLGTAPVPVSALRPCP